MNRIIIVDCNYVSETECIITLKKVYNITLLDRFPTVLESLICEYVNDIIEAKVFKHTYSCSIYIKDQYINCILVSFSFGIMHNDNQYGLVLHQICDNIVSRSNLCFSAYPYIMLLNTYMKKYYNKDNYLNMIVYHDLYNYNIICNRNILLLQIVYSHYKIDTLTIEIENNRLFKNMLCIIKCVGSYIRKKMKTSYI